MDDINTVPLESQLDPAIFQEEQQQIDINGLGMGMQMQMNMMPDHDHDQHQHQHQHHQHPSHHQHPDVHTHPHQLDHAHAHPHLQQQQQHQLQHSQQHQHALQHPLPHAHTLPQQSVVDPSLEAHVFQHPPTPAESDLTPQPSTAPLPLPDTNGSSVEPIESLAPLESVDAPAPTKTDSPTKTPSDADEKDCALPLLRTLALELGKDRPKNGDLSKESRIAIVAAVAAGQSKNAVAEAFGISPSTVRRALERWQTRHSNASRPKPGRKPKLTQEAELLLVQAAQAQPGASLKELGSQYGVCYATAKTVLKKHRAGRYSDLPPDPPPDAAGAA